jgi:hypothetical protein
MTNKSTNEEEKTLMQKVVSSRCKSTNEEIERKIFETVYQWGRVGIIVDENCKTYQSMMKDLRQKAKKELIDGLIEWAEKKIIVDKYGLSLGSINKGHNKALKDLIHHLNSLK